MQNSAGETLKIEQQSHGYLTFKASSCYLKYQDAEGVLNVYKYHSNRLLIIRKGAVEHRQEFVVGEEKLSTYFNSGIILEIKTITNKLQFEQLEGIVKIYLEYQLYINGVFQGLNKVLIRTKECT